MILMILITEMMMIMIMMMNIRHLRTVNKLSTKCGPILVDFKSSIEQ